MQVGDLPFMFKILSIGKALSIQAHPDKLLVSSSTTITTTTITTADTATATTICIYCLSYA
jgi:mannose-6-phosphate isomerase class I